MSAVSVMIFALVAVVAPAAAFTPPHPHNNLLRTQTEFRTLVLGAVPNGWAGGFAESKPAYAYPKLGPDLSDLPILDNMANIKNLTRMQKVPWPQFSWLTVPGKEKSRVYQMFAPDISRVGYSDEGRVYSVICPQQGFGTKALGTLNVEVTVTGCRGWCDEPGQTIFFDLGVKGRIWFSRPNDEAMKKRFGLRGRLERYLNATENMLDSHNFPFSKEHAINITTSQRGQPWNPVFQLFNGTDPSFPHPEYAQHWHEAYGVGHLNVEIGELEKTGDAKIDKFNQLVVDLFNIASGNMLRLGSTLSWNVWSSEPELVDQDEWENHAEVWRESFDVDHAIPGGNDYRGHETTFFDGKPFSPWGLKSLGKEIGLVLAVAKNERKNRKRVNR
jgi:hypothetical protein